MAEACGGFCAPICASRPCRENMPRWSAIAGRLGLWFVSVRQAGSRSDVGRMSCRALGRIPEVAKQNLLRSWAEMRIAIGLLVFCGCPCRRRRNVATGWAGAAAPGIALDWQLGFQDAVTPVMQEINRFHNFILIIITRHHRVRAGASGVVMVGSTPRPIRPRPRPRTTADRSVVDGGADPDPGGIAIPVVPAAVSAARHPPGRHDHQGDRQPVVLVLRISRS